VLSRRVRTSSAAFLLVAALVMSGCSSGPVGSPDRASPSGGSPTPSSVPASPSPSSSVVMAVPPAPDTTSPATTVSVQPGGLGGGDAVYLETPPGAVLLVRWTERDGQLQGVFTVTETAATAAGTTTRSMRFTGLLDHQHLTLTLDQALGSTTTLTGSVRGSQLLLTVPQGDGQLVDAPFAASSVSDYNTAVAGLADQGHRAADAAATATAAAQASAAAAAADALASAAAASAAAAAAAEKAREDQVVSSAGDRVGTAIGAVNAADQTLKGLDPTLSTELADERTARTTVDTDYAAARTISQHCTATTGGDLGTAQGQVSSDVGAVDSAQGAVESAAPTVNDAADAVTSAVTDARSALTDLVNAQHQYPASAGQVETGAKKAVDAATGPAATRAQAATAAVTKALAEAKTLDDSAHTVDSKAGQLTSC